MIEELPDDIDNDELDDVEPVGDEANSTYKKMIWKNEL